MQLFTPPRGDLAMSTIHCSDKHKLTTMNSSTYNHTSDIVPFNCYITATEIMYSPCVNINVENKDSFQQTYLSWLVQKITLINFP